MADKFTYHEIFLQSDNRKKQKFSVILLLKFGIWKIFSLIYSDLFVSYITPGKCCRVIISLQWKLKFP